MVCALFAALTVVMTVTPYFGYIKYNPVAPEITTIHIVVILAAAILGPKDGALIGGIWGITCLCRAFTDPAFALFINPLISVLPRIIVGLVAGAVSKGLLKKAEKKPKAKPFVLGLTAVVGTLTNTVLVLTAMHFFGDMINVYADLYKMVSMIYTTIISVNGIIELVAAVIIVPALYMATERYFKNKL